METRGRLLAVLGLAFGVYLAVGSLSYAFPDFLDHAMAASRIADGQVLYRDHVEHINVYHYPPVYLYTLGAVYAVAGPSLLAGKALVALSTVACGWLVFRLGERLLDARRAWLATGFFLANPVTVVGVYGGYFDAFVTLFVLSSFLLVLDERPLAAGAALAVGFTSKPFPAVFLPAVAAYYVRTDPGSGWSLRSRESLWSRESLRSLRTNGSLRAFARFVAGFAAVVALVSLPFLVLAPRAYVRYAFLYSFQRPAASLSLYYYFAPWLTATPATVLLPGGFVGLGAVALAHSRLAPERVLVDGSGVLLLGFLLFNRINYPHYLVYLVPLLALAVARHSGSDERLAGAPLWGVLVATFGVVLAGAAVWAYPWWQGVAGFRSSPLFWVGAGTYFLGAFALLAAMARSLGVDWRRAVGVGESSDA